ncbi:MAG: ABC transporter substrate-binding protein [Clostridiales bacterium]|nr:ABC transporter substrate-binding protein [Clostridiales bacterium]
MKKLLALLLALAMCLSLAACGSGDTTEDAATEDETATADDASAEEEADDAEADTTEDEASTASAGAETEDETETAEETASLTTVTEGVLTMSTNAAFPPYEMTTDDGGFEGIDVEIATAIAEKLGLELQIDDMDFDSALLAVQQGKSDIVMAGVSVTEDRLLVMDFSDSYATGVQVVIVPEGSEVTVDTLGDYVIGTQRATTGNIYCTDDYGEDHVVAYDNGITAVQALMNGQVDCVVIDSAPAQEFVAANPGLTILDTEYVSEEYAIGMAKGNTALVEAVNNALAELTADGTIQEIVDKYIAAE